MIKFFNCAQKYLQKYLKIRAYAVIFMCPKILNKKIKKLGLMSQFLKCAQNFWKNFLGFGADAPNFQNVTKNLKNKIEPYAQFSKCA
jgi:hypothetical protein